MVGQIHIMGILNLTPDSFFVGSRASADDAPARIQALFDEGADVVDLGACSTRPGSVQPSEEEEWARLRPVLEAAAGRGWALSLDTWRSGIVMRAFDTVGAFVVNDISAGALDGKMLATAGRLDLPYLAMHMRGTPETMQQYTQYPDITEAVIAYFRDFAHRAACAGIRDWMADPGFGFAKTPEQNYTLLRELHRVVAAVERPVLVGLSRKSMVYNVLGITPQEAMPATQVVQFAALERGATWLRVHDVAQAVHTARIYSTMYTSSPGAAK